MKLPSQDFESCASAIASKLSQNAQICIYANCIADLLGFSFPQKVSVGTFMGTPKMWRNVKRKKTVIKAYLKKIN